MKRIAIVSTTNLTDNRILTNVFRKVGITVMDYQFMHIGRNMTRQILLDMLKGFNVAVPLDSFSLKLLTNEDKLTSYRGSIMSAVNGMKVIPTYHPETCQKDFKLTVIMQSDFHKIQSESMFPEIRRTERQLIIKPHFDEVMDFLHADIDCFSYDIETSYLNILCIGIATSPQLAMSIPFTTWDSSQLHKILTQIGKLMADKSIEKVGHNILFDNQYLIRFLSMVINNYHDTMLMHHTCYSELPKSLAFCTSIYTNETFYKDELKEWKANIKDDERLWLYNAKDAAVTLECYYVLQKEIAKLGVEKTYEYTRSLIEPVLFMCLDGMNLDKQALQTHIEMLESNLHEALKLFKESFPNVNPQSPKQLMEVAKKLGLNIPVKHGKETMDAKTVEKLSASNKAFGLVKAIRYNQKLISTYLSSETDPIDGKIRFSLNIAGTETGRLSSNKSVFGYGYNFQNIPKQLRNIIIPDEGMMFTEVDLVGAEAMVVAYESDDEPLIQCFESGRSIHNLTAQLIWNVSDSEIEEERKRLESLGKHTNTMYYMAKKVRHSGNYKGTWVTLSEQLGISAQKSKQLLERFYSSSPNLTKWHTKVWNSLVANRTIVTPTGRKRFFFGYIDAACLRKALAFIAQDTVVTTINKGLESFYRNTCAEHKDISIKLQVHDSILIQHPPDKKQLVYNEIKKHLAIPITSSFNKTYYFGLDIKSGYNWRDLNETM